MENKVEKTNLVKICHPSWDLWWALNPRRAMTLILVSATPFLPADCSLSLTTISHFVSHKHNFNTVQCIEQIYRPMFQSVGKESRPMFLKASRYVNAEKVNHWNDYKNWKMLPRGQCVMLHETPCDTVHCRSHMMHSFKSERTFHVSSSKQLW